MLSAETPFRKLGDPTCSSQRRDELESRMATVIDVRDYLDASAIDQSLIGKYIDLLKALCPSMCPLMHFCDG